MTSWAFRIFAGCRASCFNMGVVVNPREWWSQKRKELETRRPGCDFMIPSVVETPLDPKEKQLLDKIAQDKRSKASQCTEGIGFFPLSAYNCSSLPIVFVNSLVVSLLEN